MARLDDELLGRVESICDRVLNLCDEPERQGRSRRIVEQVTGAGTAIGANMFEAAEAMSRADFVKCLAIANKELNESRFWIRLISRRSWVATERLESLESDLNGLRRVLGAMIARTKRNGKPPTAVMPTA
ncbi:MAG: four helix bundle protein [Phycisphaerales bacterium]